MLDRMETPYEIVRHERLVPLKFSGVFEDIEKAEPGDALIAFSRKKVLAIAAALEKKGIKASVIYGALPPAARREEVHRFAQKETTVVVATDAIGMGISLPIKRVIFTESDKFDGSQRRQLSISEIKQVAGRAGRYMKYDLGEVLAMEWPEIIEAGLKEPVPEIRKLQIAFPREALEYDYPLDRLLRQWDELPEDELYQRTDMSGAEKLLAVLGKNAASFPRTLLFDLITCPVDERNDELISYWLSCCMSIAAGETVPKPSYPETSLSLCELKYQAYDVYHQLLRRIGIEDDCLADKERLCGKINAFLVHEKKDFLRKCRICGREIPVSSKFGVCDSCFRRGLRSGNKVVYRQ
jgi:ATP-dependent RNA helicase SUPV3L1/SUV3